MEAQLQRPSHHHEDAGLHSGEGEHHGEKKSVLKKVKEKAKKIKDTIKKHGHGHEHEQEHVGGIHREERRNDYDQDIVNDPEIHGAPIYESTVVRSMNLPRGANTDLDKEEDKHKHHANLGNPSMEAKPNIPVSGLEEDPHSPNNSPAKAPPPSNGGNQDSPDSSNKPLSEYAHKVYDKVAGAGSAVMSMAQGGEGQSMKGYLSEKLRPGEEEKALSEEITDTLHKKKEAVWSAAEEQRSGKVTVSKEVADRLGTAPENKREGEDALAAGEESSGQGVAERLTDAVSSWLGKSTGMETAQASLRNSYVDNAGGGGPMSSK